MPKGIIITVSGSSQLLDLILWCKDLLTYFFSMAIMTGTVYIMVYRWQIYMDVLFNFLSQFFTRQT